MLLPISFAARIRVWGSYFLLALLTYSMNRLGAYTSYHYSHEFVLGELLPIGQANWQGARYQETA